MTEEDKKWLLPEEVENIKDRLWVENEFGTGEEALSEITVIQNLIACRKMLKKHEWSETVTDITDQEDRSCCPECGAMIDFGTIPATKTHKPDCALAALLPETCR
jgi:hypothetical protein